MISRKSTKLIAEAYGEHFKSSQNSRGVYGLKKEKMNDFFYEEEYELWFLNVMKEVARSNQPKLIKALMELHTGQSLIFAATAIPFYQRPELGQKLLKKLAEDILKLYDRIPLNVDYNNEEGVIKRTVVRISNSYNRPASKILEKLKSQLEVDGYVYRGGALLHVESSVIDEQGEQSYLENLISNLSLSDPTTIQHHIKLAEEHFVGGRYSDSIGNSRHFLEAILAQVLEQISNRLGRNLHSNVYRNATTTRDHLEREGLLTTDEKETIGKIYGLLSNTGGHAYIARKDQARLMWHLALTLSQFVLLRYEGFVSEHS